MPKPIELPHYENDPVVSFELARPLRKGSVVFRISAEDVDLVKAHENWHIVCHVPGRMAVVTRKMVGGRHFSADHLSKMILERIAPDSPNLRYRDGNSLNLTRPNLKPHANRRKDRIASPDLTHLGVHECRSTTSAPSGSMLTSRAADPLSPADPDPRPVP